MNDFTRQHEKSILGQLNGFDRVRFRGTLRFVSNGDGLGIFLHRVGVRLTQFKDFAMGVTERIKAASLAAADAFQRPHEYLRSATENKEAVARRIAQRDNISEGLVCVLTCVEPCTTFSLRCDARGMLRPQAELRKCLHVYHYYRHPLLGWMHARLQTWFPFTIKVYLNGREWLARQMERATLGYQRRENCFVNVSDVKAAQGLLDEQLRTNWPTLLNSIAHDVSPGHEREFAAHPLHYYWSAEETEWASDVMFRSPQKLAALYPELIRQSMTTLGSEHVMRFLGRRVGSQTQGMRRGEVLSDLRRRPEGVRVKHMINSNSIKMYDKQGSVLRVETTINDVGDFRVYRRAEGKPDAPMDWHRLRKGVADLHRRAELSQRANERYLDALGATVTPQRLEKLLTPLSQPTRDDRGRRVRALNLLSDADKTILKTIGRGEFILNGFRNRDLRGALFPDSPAGGAPQRRQSAAISRKLRLLRTHGLIVKIQGTHRYRVSAKGRRVLTTLAAACAANAAQLAKAA